MYVVPGSLLTPALRIVRPLKEGAVGNVWVGESTVDGLPLAVKFLSEDMVRLSSEARKRFQREAKAAIQLDHPHIIRTFDAGEMDDGTPYLVMELLTGESLGERLERAGPMHPHDLAEVVRQVADALAAAHGLGLVHRDVKPDNIFLVADQPEFHVKVLDFGTVKQLRQRSDSLLTATGMIVGTPEYMSPEQVFASKDVDHRADLWGLGAVAYHALTGHLPFEGDSPHALVLAIANAEHPPPSRWNRQLTAEVDGWFARALARAPADRFGSAPEMAAAFADAVGAPAGGTHVDPFPSEEKTLPFQPALVEAAPALAPDAALPAATESQRTFGPPASTPTTGPAAPGASVEGALLAATQPGARLSPLARSPTLRRRWWLVGGAVASGLALFGLGVALVFARTRPRAVSATPVSASSPLTALPAATASPAPPADAGSSTASVDEEPTDGGAGAEMDAAAGDPGYLTIVCVPRCDQVILLGRALGPGPVLRTPVPPGSHEVTVRLAGEPSQSFRVEIVAGRVTFRAVQLGQAGAEH